MSLPGADGVTLHRFPYADVVALVDGTFERPPAWHPEYASGSTGLPGSTGSVSAIAAMLLAAYEAMGLSPGDDSPWWLFQVVVDGVVVGDVGFHGPPDPADPTEVEVGYQVVPAWRRRGVATRACALLLQHAWRHGAVRVHADAEPENVASRAVLRANGFRLAETGAFAATPPPRER